MLLEKAIRKRQSPVPSPGHQEVDSEITLGSPLIQLKPQPMDPLFVDELMDWPSMIDLLVHWERVPMDPNNVSVQEIVSDIPMGVSAFYENDITDKPELAKQSRNQAIKLTYHHQARLYIQQRESMMYGTEGEELTLDINEEESLFMKPYLYQEPQALVQIRDSVDEGRWRITSPKTQFTGENRLPLLAYGCHAPLGCRLVDIEQVYASIGTTGKDTSIRLYKEGLLKREGVVQPHGGTIEGWQYNFIESQAQTSLIADILKHKIPLTITMGDVQRTYVSAGYGENIESDQLIYVSFKPRNSQV
jgi:hypothetical protein